MKKRILILLILMSSLLTIACGKSESEKVVEGASETTNQVEVKIEEEREKYNTYVDLYNELGASNPILEFDKSYLELFQDENGKYRKAPEKGYVETFAMQVASSFVMYDEILEKAGKYIDEKPKYNFDENVEKIIDLSAKTKQKILEMSDYYTKGFYLDDDYAKGEKFHKEYNELINELANNAGIFIDGMEEIERAAKQQQLEEFEKSGAFTQLNMQKFNIGMNTFLDVVYNRDNLKFTAEEIQNLKNIKEDLEFAQKELENLSDKQLEDEGIPLEKFKNEFLSSTRELIEYSSSLITRIEKGQAEEEIAKRIDDYAKSYSKVIKAHNDMIK